MPGQTIAFRPTAKQLQILDEWITSHQEQDGDTLTTSDALRAAIDALAAMEKRRAQAKERNKRWRAAEAHLREIGKRYSNGHPIDDDQDMERIKRKWAAFDRDPAGS